MNWIKLIWILDTRRVSNKELARFLWAKENNMPEFFEKEEVDKLIMALAHGQGTFTEEDCEIVYDWALECRLSAAMLQSVLDGRIYVIVKDGEVLVKQGAG
jgi:hypothetical protein